MTVRPGQHDLPLFWLTMLGAVRTAAGIGTGGAPLPAVTPGANGSALVDKVLSELQESCDRFVLVIDDLHELSSPEAGGQLTSLLTRLPPGVRAIAATRRDLPLRLHKLRLAGDLAEIRAAELRFTEDETRQLLAAAGIALPGPVAAMLHQRTEGWAAGRGAGLGQPGTAFPALRRERVGRGQCLP
jgi:LuxR family transcriptional regulator, maltose regulon positive regulatory protein